MGRYDRSTTITDASGDFISVGNPLPVSGTGGGGGGGTSQTDKTTFGEGTGVGTPIMGVVNDTMAGLVGEDKTAAVRITPARGFHCNLRDEDGNEIGTLSAPLRIDPIGSTPQPVSGTVTIQDGGGSITVDGTVAATQSGSWTVGATQSGGWSVSITGSVTVANLNTADYDTGAGTVTQSMVGIALPASGGPVAGGTSTNPVRTDPTGATAQPVTDGGGSLTVDGSVSISGSVTVTGTVAATQSGTWATQLTDGSLTASVRNTGSNDSLNVAITDASGNQITSFGGGTQYADGDTDATPTGTLAVWFDTANTLRAVSAAKPLPVNVISGSSGSVDDSPFGIATDNVSPAGALFNDTLTDSVDEGDVGLVRMSGTRLLYVTTHSGDPVVVSDGGGSVTIDGSVSITGSVTVTGTVAVTQSGVWSVGLASGSNTVGKVDQGLGGASAWKVDGSAVTQPVSGTVAATQSGGWTVTANAGTGTFAVKSEVQTDYDSGAGSQSLSVFGLALPGTGGAVAGGTATNPVRTDPTGSTAQPVTDNGGSLTVDGSVTVSGTVAATQSGSWTVTADAGSGTFTVNQTNAATADYDTGAGTVTQVMLGVALPASGGPVAGGTATNPLRTDPTGTTAQPVTDNGGSLTVDGSVSISGSVTVTGTVAATQSGTWNVGLSTGTNSIGDVRSITTSLVPGTSATHLGKAEDAGHTSGDTGVFILAVRNDSRGTLAGSDLDYAPFQLNSSGDLRVDGSAVTQPVSGTVSISGSVTVSGTIAATQSGTWNVGLSAGSNTVGKVDQGTGGASAWKVDGSAVTQPVSGTVAATQSGTWTVQQGTPPWSVSQSGTWTVGLSTGTNSIGDVRSITTSVVPGTSATHLGKAEDAGHTSGDTGVMSLAVRNDTRGTLAGTDLDYAPFQLNSSGDLRVDGSAVAQPVTDNGGSLTVDGSVSISGSVTVTGTVAATQSGSWTVTANAGSGTFGVAQTNLATADYDTGAGTVTESMMGIALPASGGPVAGGTATNPLRNDPTGTTAQPVTDNGGSLTVDGSVSVSGTVAATQSGTWTVQQGSAPWSVSDGGGSLTVDGPLTDAQLRATPVPVSGTVTITDGSGPVTVDGTVAVSGNVTVVQTVATNLKVDASGVAVPVTDNGGSLTVDGTVSISGSVDTELPAAVTLGNGIANPTTPVLGAANLVWNGTTWDPCRDANQANGVNAGPTSIGIPAFNLSVFDTTTGEYRRSNSAASGVAGGLDGTRVLASGPMGYDGSTFYNFRLDGSKNLNVSVNAALPAGSNTIGKVDQGTAGASAWKVDGSAVIQPVSDAGGSLTVDGAVTTTETRPGSTTSVVDLLSATDATRVLTILAANASRRGATVRNDTDTALLIREGGSASLTNYTDILPAGARYILDYPASTGILTAYLPQVPQGQLIATERS